MKTYKAVKLVIIDLRKEDVLTVSGGDIKGVYECVNELDSTAKQDWF